MLEPLLETGELAQQLGVSRRWIYTQVEDHGLPCYRFGKALAFEASVVRTWLEQHRAGAWPEPCAETGPDGSLRDAMEMRSGG